MSASESVNVNMNVNVNVNAKLNLKADRWEHYQTARQIMHEEREAIPAAARAMVTPSPNIW